jgi:hypothetical protein
MAKYGLQDFMTHLGTGIRIVQAPFKRFRGEGSRDQT